MAVSSALLLLAAIWGHVTAAGNPGYCADQPESVQGQAGGSVTIPCRFTYPKELGPIGEVRVYWRAGTGGVCGNSPFIYNHTEKYTRPDYRGRIALVGDPEGSGTGSIRIDRLRESDTKYRYCCRVQLIKNNQIVQQWQSSHTTSLELSGKASSNPRDPSKASPIPCRYRGTEKDVLVKGKAGQGGHCSGQFDEKKVQGQGLLSGSVVSFLEISDLSASDSRRYCCRNAHSSSPGEDLAQIAGFTVTQSKEISARKGQSVCMDCHYDHPADREPLWIGVYWRVRDDWGKYVYHPDDESIQPHYRGWTRLMGNRTLNRADSLCINNVTEMDSQTYYCLVVSRFCSGVNVFTSVIQQGEGTTLSIQEIRTSTPVITSPTATVRAGTEAATDSRKSPPVTSKPGSWNAYIATAAVLTLVVLVIVAGILIWKKKDQICKAAKPAGNLPPSGSGAQLETLTPTEKVSQEPVYSEIDMGAKTPTCDATYATVQKSPRALKEIKHTEVEEDSVLYAALDLTKPSRVEPRAQPDPQEDTIYSAMKTK